MNNNMANIYLECARLNGREQCSQAVFTTGGLADEKKK